MGIKRIPSETPSFHFHNENPKNKRAGDCVIRALACATNMSWDDVFDNLCEKAKKKKLMPNDKKVYEAFLNEHGLQCKQPKKWDNTKYTGVEFCGYLDDKCIHNSIVANIGGHHVVAIVYDEDYGYRVYDTWNSTDGCIGKYWVID